MIEAVGSIGRTALAESPSRPVSEEQVVELQRPTSLEAADFAQAAAQPWHETVAVPPTEGNGLLTRLAEQVDGLSDYLQTLIPTQVHQKGGGIIEETSPARKENTLPKAQDQIDEAVAQIERAYMFAVETTMASRGSTESTKILNTLLKGQ